MKRCAWIVVLAVLGALSGCFGKQTYRWKEEVLLHDGRLIVIERSVRTGEVPVEIGQPPGESDYTLTFSTEDGKSVRWEAGKSFWPMVLDFKDGRPYVVAGGSTGPDYERQGCPRPPYFFFRYAGGQWQRIDYEQFPKEIRRANLLVGPTGDADRMAAVKRGLVTREDVRKSHARLNREDKEIREDAPNPCAHWGNDYRYVPTK
jgi:hypothetical protein